MDNTQTYLALGDSYTIGESVLESERFPVQTVQHLKNLQFGFSQPDIIAATGWTTGDLINALNNQPPQHLYSIVTLLIGVNNQYQHKTLYQYKIEFSELLNRAILYAANKPAHVLVLSIPDYSVTPFAAGRDTTKIANEIDAFNNINKGISLDAGVYYIDITPISREAKTNASLIAADGLHPSGMQYKRWSELLASVISKVIQ